MSINKEKRRLKIRKSIRSKISGTKERPRVSVFKSNKAIYSQIIDDLSGSTLVSCSSVDIKKFGKNNIESSKEVGVKLAEKAKKKGIKKVLFDRGGYVYHGKIKSFAEGAREGGLIF
ncbi:MAG: 50S ribosomal protein L18 [Cytophagales bacterium]|jgi:large subunit ribosomal protein L18|nr:50S ribosomal protein L18 [Cytophagales bacterium]PDH42936.1 MAG: 50S ribosomal protein L18 [Rhodothermaeota bacterium MED-G19]